MQAIKRSLIELLLYSTYCMRSHERVCVFRYFHHSWCNMQCIKWECEQASIYDCAQEYARSLALLFVDMTIVVGMVKWKDSTLASSNVCCCCPTGIHQFHINGEWDTDTRMRLARTHTCSQLAPNTRRSSQPSPTNQSCDARQFAPTSVKSSATSRQDHTGELSGRRCEHVRGLPGVQVRVSVKKHLLVCVCAWWVWQRRQENVLNSRLNVYCLWKQINYSNNCS